MKTALAALLLWFAFPVACAAWPGKVLSVHDGDTLTVAPCGDANAPIIVRLYGTDAPETDQPRGADATAYLQQRLPIGAAVECVPYGVDRYGRSVALVEHNGHAVNAEMIAAGLAWVYPRYCKAKFCGRWKKLEAAAHAERRGLWAAPAPTEPWKWRHKARK